jgi:hypothetical protein
LSGSLRLACSLALLDPTLIYSQGIASLDISTGS